MLPPPFMPWLPVPPADLAARLKGAQEQEIASTVRRYAATALDINGLTRIAKAIKGREADIAKASGCPVIRVGLVGDQTLDYLAVAIRGSALRHNFVADVTTAPFGQVMQSLLDPQGAMASDGLDFVHVALTPATLGLDHTILDGELAAETVERALDNIATLARGAVENLGATPVFATLWDWHGPVFGGFDPSFAGAPSSLISAFNAGLPKAAGPGAVIIDLARAAAWAGAPNWSSARDFHRASLAVTLDATPLHADFICRGISAARGRSRRCLVLDLDNTLWGGVVGDDGAANLEIGRTTPAGAAFAAVQSAALTLKQRGIVLAVCSKNNEEQARTPFFERPEMVLKVEDIALFKANWSDKARNLRDIARQLNLGVDALAFFDDNPVERAQIRQELPQVAVIEPGSEPAEYARNLLWSGFFEANGYSSEDSSRADYYRANALREREAASAPSDIAGFLRSLDMEIDIRPFDAAGRARIAQLIAKSNQYNLTTRRYSLEDVAQIENDPSRLALQVRLADKYGDNGMISVVIFEKGDVDWVCDTWLMSCRVIGRRVEDAILAAVAQAARRERATGLVGNYIPSGRNALVEDHFERIGFSAEGAGTVAGATAWRLDLATYSEPELPFRFITKELSST